MSKYKLSVIVPTYNVEEYLFECLESLNNQTLKEMQVIIVDDGSTDSSGKIAKDYAATHKNFVCRRIPNGGLGHARNYGIKFARGKYVAFVDSDDIIDRYIYEIAVNEAEKNKADMAVFDVMRFNSKRAWGSKLQRLAFDGAETVTHITKHPQLIYDAISCNKVISMKFWKKNRFRFPEGMLYEDIPVTIPLHYLCNKCVIVDKVGYYWRARDGATVSITQNRGDAKNFLDRLKAVKKIDTFFRKHNITNQALIDEKLVRALEIDFLTYVNIVNTVPDELCELFFTELKKYIEENIPLEYLEKISLLSRQKYRYLLDGNLEALVELLQNQSADYSSAPITERDERFFIECSDDLFQILDRDVTAEQKKLRPNKSITEISVMDDEIEIEGQLYFPRLELKSFDEQKIEAFLVNSFTGNRLPLEVVPFKNETLTDEAGFVYNVYNKKHAQYNYDGTGFKVRLKLSDISVDRQSIGENRIELVYENRLRSGREWMWVVTRSLYTKIEDTAVMADGKVLRLNINLGGELVCTLEKTKIHALNTLVEEGHLKIELSGEANSLYAEADNGKKLVFTKKTPTCFEAACEGFKKNRSYVFFTDSEAFGVEQLLSSEKNSTLKTVEKKAMLLTSLKSYRLYLMVEGACSCLYGKSEEGGVLSFKTKTFGSAKGLKTVQKAQVTVVSEITGETMVLAEAVPSCDSKKLSCEFSINFDDPQVTKNFTSKYRDVFVDYISEDGSVLRHALYTQKGLKFLHDLDSLEIKMYRSSFSRVRLLTHLVWPKRENTGKKRIALIEKEYPNYLEQPINPKLVLFESMWGRKFSCNPRAIYEYIDENYPEYDCVWAFNDPRMPITGHGRRVRRGSLEYYKVLATAKYLVNNVNFTAYMTDKREGQVVINTMHGTPYKTIGLDSVADFNTEEKRQKYIEKCATWDHLTVQGSFTEEKAEHCFGFKNNILRTGYPRCDALFANNRDEYKSEIKQRLGIPEDKKIVVYAPTWRVQGKFDMQLDVHKLKAMLGDEYILVTKIHHLCSQVYDLPKIDGFVYDLTTYGNIEDLYLIADVLITDYSSVMFDYGILKKPQIFYVYDLAEYEENLRGVYFDLKTEAPGPIVFTNDELIDAIKNIDNQSEEIIARTNAFNNKYINYECENSSEKVFNEVFSPEVDLK